jgi:hypothetical protein
VVYLEENEKEVPACKKAKKKKNSKKRKTTQRTKGLVV